MTTTADARRLAKLTGTFIEKLSAGQAELKEIDKDLAAALKDIERDLKRVITEACRARLGVFDKLDLAHEKWFSIYEELDENDEIDPAISSFDAEPTSFLGISAQDAFESDSYVEQALTSLEELRESLGEVDTAEVFREMLPPLKTYQKEAERFEEPEEDEDEDEGE